MFKWLRFSNALEGRALNIFYELVNTLESFLVGALPKQIVLPRMLGEHEFHSDSFRSVPSPRSNWTTDSSSRRAFSGLRNK